jgi:hypothetical protein
MKQKPFDLGQILDEIIIRKKFIPYFVYDTTDDSVTIYWEDSPMYTKPFGLVDFYVSDDHPEHIVGIKIKNLTKMKELGDGSIN